MKKFEMLNIICNNCNLTSKEKLVVHYFVYRSNQEGVCYPAVNTMARHCGVSERTIQRATKKLQERGYIIISKREINGKQTSNAYRLILEDKKETHVTEAETVLTAVYIAEGQMNVVLLEDLLITNEDQQEHDLSLASPSGEVNITSTDTNTDELPVAHAIEELKSEVISEDIIIQKTILESDNRETAGESLKMKLDITIQIWRMIWINDRILYIYKAIRIIINVGYIVLRVNVEYKLILCRHGAQSRRFFMPGLGVPP